MIILLVISIITFVFCLTGKKVNRIEGFLLVLMYVADMVFAIVR
jgi:cation:H+ antiporter